jgi:SNF2 family DNA or RNA helicase
MPNYLGDYDTFRDKYEIDVVRGDEQKAERLKKIVKPFILRRLKTDVLKELPPKTESVIESPLESKQKELYEANLALVRDSLQATPELSRVVVLSMLTKLRQICCDPSLIYPDYDGNSAKTEACMELIERAVEGGHRILLFSQFTTMIDLLRRRLADKGITHYVLKGDTPKSERIRLVNKFNAGDTKVFLISLKAGGTGLNLTGADVVIHYDPWWNESVMNQATDRAYRIGQTKSVQVYKLVVKNSIEEKIMELQAKKTALGTSVVGKTNGLKEIIELLSE